MELVENIDEIDRKILQIITQNARKPFKDVAEQVGISRAASYKYLVSNVTPSPQLAPWTLIYMLHSPTERTECHTIKSLKQ